MSSNEAVKNKVTGVSGGGRSCFIDQVDGQKYWFKMLDEPADMDIGPGGPTMHALKLQVLPIMRPFSTGAVKRRSRGGCCRLVQYPLDQKPPPLSFNALRRRCLHPDATLTT
jgi:hypothetical protein